MPTVSPPRPRMALVHLAVLVETINFQKKEEKEKNKKE